MFKKILNEWHTTKMITIENSMNALLTSILYDFRFSLISPPDCGFCCRFEGCRWMKCFKAEYILQFLYIKTTTGKTAVNIKFNTLIYQKTRLYLILNQQIYLKKITIGYVINMQSMQTQLEQNINIFLKLRSFYIIDYGLKSIILKLVSIIL